MTVRVKSLYVYPVKGCRGQSIQQAKVGETGFALDRHWMVVTTAKGKGIYQIPVTKMALVEPTLPEGAITGDWRSLPKEEAYLTLRAPGATTIKVPLFKQENDTRKLRESSIWEWRGPTQDEGDEAAAWLSAFLEKDVRLVRYLGQEQENGKGVRQVADKWVPPGHSLYTSFDYGFQFLVTTVESGADLEQRMGGLNLPEDRWRANIVLEGAQPWEEDLWKQISISDGSGAAVQLVSVRPCDRCKVTGTDQRTLEVAEEPLRTLKEFRKGEHLGLQSPPAMKSAVFYGWYMLSLNPGSISVGSSVEVTQKRKDFTDFVGGPKLAPKGPLAGFLMIWNQFLEALFAMVQKVQALLVGRASTA